MSVAALERICDHVYIIRVFDTDDIVEPAKYRFFTVAKITGDSAYLKGMCNAKVTIRDFRLMLNALIELGIKSMGWHHNGKMHTLYKK